METLTAKEHPEYSGYLFYPDGAIQSFKRKTPIWLSLCKNTGGYYQVNLCNETGTHKKDVHIMIATLFVYNPDPTTKTHVNHLNGKKYDNHFSNLQWCTPQENTIHAYVTKLAKGKKGSTNSQSYLTDLQVEKICTLLVNSTYTHKQIQAVLGLRSHRPIEKISAKTQWLEISDQYWTGKLIRPKLTK